MLAVLLGDEGPQTCTHTAHLTLRLPHKAHGPGGTTPPLARVWPDPGRCRGPWPGPASAAGQAWAGSHTLTSLPSVLTEAPLHRFPDGGEEGRGEERVEGRLTQGSEHWPRRPAVLPAPG